MTAEKKHEYDIIPRIIAARYVYKDFPELGHVLHDAESIIKDLICERDSLKYARLNWTSHRCDASIRLAEIIAYCAQEGCDGEPYDTINAIARGEYSTRGGGR